MWKPKWRGKRISALRIVIIYLLIGGLWIFFSDRILLQLATDIDGYLMLQTYKGWIYVAGTAMLLYFLSAQEFHIRDKVEEDLAHSVEEKDELMRELHHRVKNNLQLVMSLLNLQRSTKEIDDLGRHILRQLYMRVQSIAVFHEKIYRLELYSKIPLDDYIREIINSLHVEYAEKLNNIRVDLNLEDKQVTVEQALPIGIIINELLMNCLMHAFSDFLPEDAQIRVDLKSSPENITIEVKDNGKGYDQVRSSLMHSDNDGLGYSLIHSLLRQIDASLHIEGNGGAHVMLTIPNKISTKERKNGRSTA